MLVAILGLALAYYGSVALLTWFFGGIKTLSFVLGLLILGCVLIITVY